MSSSATVPDPVPPRAPEVGWLVAEVRAHEPAVRGYLRKQFPSLDADDVVQESYLKLVRTKTRIGIASARAYFFAVARNTACTLFRRTKIYSETPVNGLPDALVIEERDDVRERSDASCREQLTLDAMDQLPARCREIFALAVLHGHSTAEIAAQLGLREATVRVQMARGLKRCVAFMRERKEHQ